MRDRVTGPCQSCKSRYLGCHDECVNYKKFRTRKDEINSALRQAKEETINEYKLQEVMKKRGVR